MSLLRNAERCLANQQAHKLLNALVPTAHEGSWFHKQTQRLSKAEQRRIGGVFTVEGISSTLLILHRGSHFISRRTHNCGKR